MPKLTIYVSDELHKAVKDADINVSRVCQDALTLVALLTPTVPKTFKGREPWKSLTADDIRWLKRAREDYEFEMQSLRQRFNNKKDTD